MSELFLVIDESSGTPPYEQVRAGIQDQVDTGVLAPGSRLPPVRTLAARLGLAANTVARAYKELELAGVLETRGRAGTFVLGRGAEQAARSAASSYVASVRLIGLSDVEIVEQVRRALG